MFWAGPMSGAIIAALVYELTLRPSHDPVRLFCLTGGIAAQGAGVQLYAGFVRCQLFCRALQGPSIGTSWNHILPLAARALHGLHLCTAARRSSSQHIGQPGLTAMSDMIGVPTACLTAPLIQYSVTPEHLPCGADPHHRPS